MVAKLQKKGAGAPQREPVVSEDEQKAMIAFYHKKQQETEKLAQEDDDAYLHSQWANPKSLKNAFSGVGDVVRPRPSNRARAPRARCSCAHAAHLSMRARQSWKARG